MNNIHIIAEAGSNYNGKVEHAKRLIDIAKQVEADSVKFQMINTYGLYLPGDYEYGNYDIKDVLDFRNQCMLNDNEWLRLAEYSKKQSIPFTVSVFDKKSLDLYMKTNPPYIKIASGDLNNISLLRQVAEYRKKIILSTGMSTLGEIEFTLNDLYKQNFSDIVLMHCTSIYPAKLEQTNLNFIDVLKSAFGFEVGFSDHTGSSHAACIALAKGVNWFEKHFTFDKTMPGLDHKYAQDENELKQYILDLRNAEKALTIRKEKVSEAENFTKKRARRGFYAAREISKGQIITENDILIVRPQGDINANEIDNIIGSTANQDIKTYDSINYGKISL